MNYFQRYLAEEFAEDYYEGRISRRHALKLIASVTGSLVVASSVLAACAPQGGETPTTPLVPATGTTPEMQSTSPAGTATPGSTPTEGSGAATPAQSSTQAINVSPDDPAIEAGEVTFPDTDATLTAYLARPAGEGTSPVVLVCHENRGLTEHIQDVTRRLAKAGYVALAVDLLSRQGGTGSLSTEEIPGLLGNQPPAQFVQDFQGGFRYLQDQAFADTGRVGMVGFCFGGGVTWQVAVNMPELKAAVPFYGPPPPVEEVSKINAAVLAIYGELDQRINQTIPAIEQAMQQNNKIYEKVIYPGADHAFHNDTGPRYNAEAAQDAWRRTLEWFDRYLS